MSIAAECDKPVNFPTSQVTHSDDFLLTLVSETNALLFTPMLAEVAGGSLEAAHISYPLRTNLRRTAVIRGFPLRNIDYIRWPDMGDCAPTACTSKVTSTFPAFSNSSVAANLSPCFNGFFRSVNMM